MSGREAHRCVRLNWIGVRSRSSRPLGSLTFGPAEEGGPFHSRQPSATACTLAEAFGELRSRGAHTPARRGTGSLMEAGAGRTSPSSARSAMKSWLTGRRSPVGRPGGRGRPRSGFARPSRGWGQAPQTRGLRPRTPAKRTSSSWTSYQGPSAPGPRIHRASRGTWRLWGAPPHPADNSRSQARFQA
jgi:hypothetical protein